MTTPAVPLHPPCPIQLPSEYPESIKRYGIDPELLLREFCLLEAGKPGFVASLKDIAERGELSASSYQTCIHGHYHEEKIYAPVYSALDMGELLGHEMMTAPSEMWLYHGNIVLGHTPKNNHYLAALMDLIDVFLPLWEQRDPEKVRVLFTPAPKEASR